MSEGSRTIKMKLHQAIQYVFSHMELHWSGMKMAVPYISGKPGGGKSEMIQSECEKRNEKYMRENPKFRKEDIGFLPITVGLIRPERFSGIPDFKKVSYEGREELQTEWSVPEIVSAMRNKSREYNKVIVLYDDWHMASPEIQASGFETFTRWSINGYDIPKNVGIILAGNSSSLAGARTGFSAVMNRVAKIHCDSDFVYWRDEFAIPNHIDPEIITFLDNESKRHLFHGEEDAREPWPSPRSWTECARSFSAVKQNNSIMLDEDSDIILASIISAHVGGEAAAEFMIWHNIYSKINARRIFQTRKWTIPEGSIERFAFVAACTDEFLNLYARDDRSKNNAFIVFGKIMGKIHKEYPELALRAFRFIAKTNYSIVTDISIQKSFPEEVQSQLLEMSRNLLPRK